MFEYAVVKLDLNGDLLWTSENFNFNSEKNGAIKLIKNRDNNFELAVFKYAANYGNSKDMAIFTVDGTTGNTIKKENSFNTSFVDDFRLRSFYALKDGGHQLIVEGLDKKTSSGIFRIIPIVNWRKEQRPKS